MYNKKLLGIVTVLLGVGFMLAFTMFWGCSSDSTGSAIVQGSLDDPTFTAVVDNINSAIDSLINNLHSPLTNPWGFPLDDEDWTNPDDNIWWGPMNPGDSSDYDYNDGWHTMYVLHLTSAGSYLYYDSVAFYVGGHSWDEFVTGIDEVKYRGSYESENENNDQIQTVEFVTRVDYENVDDLITVMTGNSTITDMLEYSEDNSDLTTEFEYEIEFDGLQMIRTDDADWKEYTGVDGDVDITMTYIVETVTDGDSNIESQDWIIEITFDGDVASVNATLERTRWSYDHNL